MTTLAVCEWWFGQEMWNRETSFHAQQSTASMTPKEPHWSPRSNGSLSDLTNTSIWLHYSISTWGPLQTLKKSSLRFGCISWLHRMAWSQRQQKTIENQCQESKTSAKMCQEPRSSRLRRWHRRTQKKRFLFIHNGPRYGTKIQLIPTASSINTLHLWGWTSYGRFPDWQNIA